MKIAVPNAIVFVLDPTNKGAQVPEYVVDELVAATSTCVSVGTQANVDGETEITLSLAGSNQAAGLTCVFDGPLDTPGGVVSVETSQSESLAQLAVDKTQVQVSIWVDDRKWPARVLVCVGNAE